MSLKRPPPQEMEFYARVWKAGKNLLIPINKDLSEIYDLEGKFVKVRMEVVGAWRLPSQKP